MNYFYREVSFLARTQFLPAGSPEHELRKYPAIVLEGSKLISDALATGGKATSLFFSSRIALEQINDLSHVLNIYYVTPRVMKQLSSLKTPPGVIALFEVPQENVCHTKEAKYHLPVSLILDRISDPGNMGSLIRSGASFGLTSILVTKGSVNIWNEKAIRGGMSAHFRIPIYQGLSWADISRHFGICDGSFSPVTVFVADPDPRITDRLIESAWKTDSPVCQPDDVEKSQRSTVSEAVGTPSPESTSNAYRLPVQTMPHFNINYVPSDYNADRRDCRIAIVLGSEAHGVSPEAFHLAHLTGGCRAVIPSAKGTNSLNVLSAASVLLGEIQRQFLTT
ncbi:unnamed protein product [Trichobilharzia regenti]|nr:unnamed protein product [Trichobilharzia regenti]